MSNLEPWFADLALPIYGEWLEADARHRAAVEALTKAETKMIGIRKLAESQGISEEAIAEAYRASRTQAPRPRPLLPVADLMNAVVAVLRERGYPMDVDAILTELEARGVVPPPRNNFQAYLSRSHLIKSVKRGLYVPAEPGSN